MTYSKKRIAEILNVDPSLITYYEQGKRTPTVGKLNQLAEIFSIPMEWLITENIGNIQVVARSHGKETPAELKEILFFQQMVADFIELLKKTGMPDYKYKGPQYPNKSPVPSIIRDIKTLLRLEEVVCYERLKDSLQSEFSVYIFEIPFQNERISGITFFRDQVFSVFINKGHTKQRRLFSIAHELGHILFHVHQESYLISRLTSTDPLEKEANQFAQMFLILETQLKKLISSKKLHLFRREYIQRLADFFNVSPESIFYTLAKKGSVQYKWKSYRPDTDYPKGYDKSWSYKDLPWFYVLTCYLAVRQDLISTSRFSEMLYTDIRTASEIFKNIEKIFNQDDIES